MNRHHLLFLLPALLFLCAPVFAQKKSKSKTDAPAVSPAPAFDATAFKALRWRNIGPFRGGRSNAVSGVIGHENTYYTGYTGGGVWRTDDAGLNWRNISDGAFKTGSVGDIAVAESDPNVVFVGMGEHAVRGVMTSYGDGVYKSEDGGTTWKNVGLEKTRHISDVIIHPQNPEVVYVAAQGALHGPNPERGIYKSTDGGQTWRKVLYIDENTGASSLSLDPNNPRVLYAAFWQYRRLPWKVESGGAGSSIWKSVDGGETWVKLSEGLPTEMGKIGISVSRANSNRVYAIVEAEKSKAGVYRSDDGGKRWTMMSNDNNLTARSWYYMEVFADPADANIVYVLNAPMMRSIDGGKSFSSIDVGHGDTHDLWINPANNQNMILGDDGGGEISFNAGQSWSTLNNQPTAQFYRVNVDQRFPYRVYGGQQDNTSVVINSRNNGYGITDKDWFEGPGCECAYIAFDPMNPVVMYGGCYQGMIESLDTRTTERKDIMQYPSLNLANPPKEMKYRFNWNAPIVASPHNPSVIYHAANVLFKTTDGGLNWQAISPDLTRNDTIKQGDGGGPLTNEGAGGENYNTINYVIESQLEKDLIYTGSDCGLVHLTRDGGKTWQNITPAGLPECLIQSIEVSPHSKGTAYLSGTRYKFNDFTSLTYKTTDYGKTWTKIANGVNTDDFIKVIREDKKVAGLLYAGAERGFYVSFNGGANWQPLQLNLPVVPITDLIQHDNDLVVSTAGRAFWILDDVSALQQYKGSFGDAVAKIYAPKTTVRFSSFSPPWLPENIPGIGRNPLDGVILDYYLKEKADTNLLTLEILDASGNVIRTYTNKKDETFKPYPGGPSPAPVIPSEAGLNRYAWDFRTEGIGGVQGAFVYGDYRGYRVAPGQYRARLTHKDIVSEAPIEVVADPRISVNPADWTAQQQLLERLTKDLRNMHEAVTNLRKVKKQLAARNEALKDLENQEEMMKQGEDLIKKIDAWEANIVESRQTNFQDVINWPSKLNAEFFDLRSKVDVHDPRITQGVRDRLRDLETQWNAHQAALRDLISKDVVAYNQLFKEQNIPAVIVK